MKEGWYERKDGEDDSEGDTYKGKTKGKSKRGKRGRMEEEK